MLAWLALCGWLCQPLYTNAQTTGAKITVLQPANSKPVTDATVVFTGLTGAEKGKQQAIPTDAKGQVTNPYTGNAAVYVYSIGYEKLTDTIPGNKAHTFFYAL